MKGISTGDEIVVEAQHGEFYLDSIAVNERYRRQGVARGLIAAFEQRGKEEGYRRLSLIVEQDHSQAYALYSKLGFEEDGDLIVSGGRYIRMVKQLD
ncbi:putative acetyltransferase [compost metagenome]